MPQIHLLCWDEENKPPSRSCLIQAGQRQVNQRSWTRIEIKPPAFGINNFVNFKTLKLSCVVK